MAQSVFDRFNARPFAWGERDCVQLFKFTVMRAGHPNPLKGAKPYNGEVGAVRALHSALKTAGLPRTAGLAELADALGYRRISPAYALPGDIIGLQGDAPFGIAMGVDMGNGKALAFAPDPESGEQRAMVGEAMLTRNGVTPAVTAWSLG